MKIGIFGGSFDPIHNGHTALVHAMAEALSLDRVVLMPTGIAPHKVKKTTTSDEDRLTMCRLATAGDPLLEVSDFEIRKGGASFTVDTLEAMHEQYPDDTLYLLMGADMFLTLTTWKRFEDIVKLAVLCTVPRDEANAEELRTYAEMLCTFGARCEVVDAPLYAVSSTEVRACVENGASTEKWLSKAVSDYIRKRGLYRGEATVDPDKQYLEILRARLRPDRFEHSLCVAAEAYRLAQRCGADPDKAYTAGLLHDIMKNTKPQLQLQILKDFDILLDAVEQGSPKLWHARSGAVYVQKVLGVEDEEILTAIRYHTTGRAGMGLLEKVLFLADFTSADRVYDDVDVMRRLVDEDMEQAMRYALGYTVRDLAKKGAPIHPDTVELYNELALKRSVN